MYHIRLIRGMSYSGAVTASRRCPDVFTEDEVAYASAMKSGYFADLTAGDGVRGREDKEAAAESTIEPGGEASSNEGTVEPGGKDSGRVDDFAEMSVDELRAYAEINGISLAGAKKKAEILGVIRESEVKAAEARSALRE